jgi:biotin carboxylase
MLSDDPYVVRAAENAGVDLTVVYGMGQRDFGMVEIPSGKQQVFVDNALSIESVVLGLHRAGVDPAGFDAVYTTDEGGIVVAAALGRLYGVPAMPPGPAPLFRDKSLMKAALRRAGVQTADFVVIEDLLEVPADFPLPFTPAVLKPIAGGASYHTYVVRSAAELQDVLARERGFKKHRTFILEEFVPGDEWHADGVVFDGELQFLSVGGYLKTCLTTLTDDDWLRTYLFDPVRDAEVHELMRPLAERVLRTLGLRTGVFHLEAFHDPATGRLTFGECAARRGGGLIQLQVLRKFGVDLAAAALQCALGVRPVLEAVHRPEEVGCVFLPYTPGVLIATPSAAELAALPNVEFAMVEWPVGMTLSTLKSTINKIGQVLITAESRPELLARADDVVRWSAERTVVVPPDRTVRQLREWYAAAAPDGARPHSCWKTGTRDR